MANGGRAMIPSVVAAQVRETILDYLRTTFSLADEAFERALFDFLEGQNGLFKGPYVDVRLPFRKAEASNSTAFQAVTRPPSSTRKATEKPARGFAARPSCGWETTPAVSTRSRWAGASNGTTSCASC